MLARELFEEFKKPSKIKKEDSIVMLYSEEAKYLVFSLGTNVDSTEDNMKQLNLLYLSDLISGSYGVFSYHTESIKNSIQRNHKDKSDQTTSIVISSVIGSGQLFYSELGCFAITEDSN